MEEGQPDTDNEHSLRGTAAHEAAAECFKQGLSPGAFENRAVTVKTAEGTDVEVLLNKEDTAAMWAYYDYVTNRIDALGPDTIHWVEERVDPGAWLSRDDMAGTADTVLIGVRDGAVTGIEVIDYKHGARHAVEVKGNPQPELYGLGAFVPLDWNVLPVQLPVRLTIVQPRCPHPQGPVRFVDMTASDLFAKLEDYRRRTAATDDPEAPLVPGDDQCHFCKGKTRCPAVNKTAIEVFIPEGEATGTEGDWGSVSATLGRPLKLISLDHKIRMLEAEPLVTAQFRAIREELTKLAVDGTPIAGHKLVRGRSNRRYTVGDDEVIKKLSRLRTREGETVGKASAQVVKPLSPDQAEKQLKPKVSDRSWKAIVKIITKPEGAPVLVPLSDPREPIKTAEQVFDKAPQETPTPEPAPWN